MGASFHFDFTDFSFLIAVISGSRHSGKVHFFDSLATSFLLGFPMIECISPRERITTQYERTKPQSECQLSFYCQNHAFCI